MGQGVNHVGKIIEAHHLRRCVYTCVCVYTRVCVSMCVSIHISQCSSSISRPRYRIGSDFTHGGGGASV